MKVKKFICRQCGAPKVNPYDGIFVICDFCSSTIDIDPWAKHEKENEDQQRIYKRQHLEIDYHDKTSKFLANNDKTGLLAYLESYVRSIYEVADYVVPPNLPKGSEFDAFIKALAGFRFDKMFAEHLKEFDMGYKRLLGKVNHYEVNGESYFRSKDFIPMFDAFLKLIEEELNIMYTGDRAIVLNKYWPRDLYERSKLTEGIRDWLPYFEKTEADIILSHYKIHQEYIEINPPEIQEVHCKECSKIQQLPVGAIKWVCHHCRTENILQSKLNCHGCGTENMLPEKWNMKIDCAGCGAEIRPVPRLYD